VLPPLLDQYLCLAEAVEDFSIQHFIAEAGVKALAITILPGRSGLDVSRFCTDGADPVPNGLGDELRAIAPTEGISRDGRNSGARSLSLQARTARGAMASQIFS